MWGGSRCIATVVAAGMGVTLLTGCGDESRGSQPQGATSPRAAATGLLRALERHDAAGMRRLMTPMAQRNESIPDGLLTRMPTLTAFRFSDRFAREDPTSNASPKGSIASIRYTTALTPPDGFDNDSTSGRFYDILVSETPGKRWLVAELGGFG